MMALRCTRKLLRYFGEKSTHEDDVGMPDTLLGDWYVNFSLYDATPMALCVNGKTRYAIVIPIEDCESIETLYIRLAQRIHKAMRSLGIAEEISQSVLNEHRGGVMIAPTNSRSVLGTMNDLAKQLEWRLDRRLQDGPVRDPADLDADLNVIPHGPLRGSHAREQFIELCRSET